ncbi:hypothetical protein LINGRAPRIM_LOCUS3299 [Linum grandiflorum]
MQVLIVEVTRVLVALFEIGRGRLFLLFQEVRRFDGRPILQKGKLLSLGFSRLWTTDLSRSSSNLIARRLSIP